MQYHQKEYEQVILELESNLKNGLTSEKATLNINKYGKNTFSPQKRDSLLKKILLNLKEPLILILSISAIVSIAMQHYVDGIGIFIAVILATGISVLQEGRSDKAFEALSKQSEHINVRVVRNGSSLYVPKDDITVGDIVHLEAGDKVPADGRIVETLNLKVNESMLTGEALAISKVSTSITGNDVPLAERKNMLYSGTLLVDGRATFIVTSIGDNTEMGKIAEELKSELKTSTPLQEKLGDLGKKISIFGSIASAGIFLFQLYKMYQIDNLNFDGIKEAFVVSVALIVAAVPEGLPTMVALTLAFNMKKMAKHNALVRKLIACETIGSINVICSDKTGTLTQNQMSVVDVWYNGAFSEVDKITSTELLNNFCINSTADLSLDTNTCDFIGNPTECALLVCANKNKVDYTNLRKKVCDPTCDYHFTSERKMMSTAVNIENGFKLYSKGAPEKILSLSNKVLYKGEVQELSLKIKAEIEENIQKLQEHSKRVLAFAYREFSQEPNWEDSASVESDLVFVGFVGIEDPLRPDVKEAIDKCKLAGISVKMLTGDNLNTARAISNQLEILSDNSLIYEVSEIDKMSDDELLDILDDLTVVARSNPSVKMRIVKLLKTKRNSVLVTGDGINDAPALKSADVGVAMGIAGTEVSKEASDIVLLDDSFSTIVKAIKWGRGIYENFQRFIQYQLTVNVAAFITAIFAEILAFGMPFTTLQLLWVNIIMDGPPALSLGLEPPREHLLTKNPVNRDASIVTKDMLFKILSNGFFIVIALLTLMHTNFLGGKTEAEEKTIVFTCFVLFQIWNAFNCREFGTTSIFTNILKNKAMLWLMLVTFTIQVLVTQLGGDIFRTVPLDFYTWLNMIGFTFTIIIFSELVKLFRIALQPLYNKKV